MLRIFLYALNDQVTLCTKYFQDMGRLGWDVQPPKGFDILEKYTLFPSLIFWQILKKMN